MDLSELIYIELFLNITSFINLGTAWSLISSSTFSGSSSLCHLYYCILMGVYGECLQVFWALFIIFNPFVFCSSDWIVSTNLSSWNFFCSFCLNLLLGPSGEVLTWVTVLFISRILWYYLFINFPFS